MLSLSLSVSLLQSLQPLDKSPVRPTIPLLLSRARRRLQLGHLFALRDNGRLRSFPREKNALRFQDVGSYSRCIPLSRKTVLFQWEVTGKTRPKKRENNREACSPSLSCSFMRRTPNIPNKERRLARCRAPCVSLPIQNLISQHASVP